MSSLAASKQMIDKINEDGMVAVISIGEQVYQRLSARENKVKCKTKRDLQKTG